MLEHRLAESLKRVISKEEERFNWTLTLSGFIKDYGLGRIEGKSIYFKEHDKAKIRELLIAQGFSLDTADLSIMSRVERLSHTPNEKAGGGAIKRDRIAVKHLKGKSIEILGEQSISLPDEAHLDISWRYLQQRCGNDCILIVENYENFNHLHLANLEFPVPYESPLVVYRGDQSESRLDAVGHLLNSMTLPVFAYVDIDPAGLVIAKSLPRLAGIVAPEQMELNTLLANSATRRPDLYSKQHLGCRQFLDDLPEEHPGKRLWNLIKKHRAGIIQERLVSENLKCIAWT